MADEPPSAPLPDWDWHMRAARLHIREGRPAAALEALEACGRLRPGHVPTQIAHASALLRCNQPGSALEQFERILSIEPCNAAAHHGAGLALHACGDRAGALDALRRAVSLKPDAWESWQSIADITPDEAERSGAVQAAARGLVALCERKAPSLNMLRQAVRALVCAGRGTAALDLLRSWSDCPDDHSLAQSLMAGVYYSIGQFEAAARHQALALPENPGQPPAVRPAFAPARALATLVKLVSIFEGGGLQPFLAAGTLLGFIRQGGPLAHDRDIDIGLMRANTDAAGPVDLIRAHPDLILSRSARPGDRYVGLTVDGIATDVFIFDLHPNGFVCGFSDLPGDIQWRHQPFGLRQVRFGEHVFRIPDPPAPYLAECYGPDWQVPDRGFASALSAPGLYQTDPHAVAYLALSRALKCLLAGDGTKAHALLRQCPQAGLAPSLAGKLAGYPATYPARQPGEPIR